MGNGTGPRQNPLLRGEMVEPISVADALAELESYIKDSTQKRFRGKTRATQAFAVLKEALRERG